MLPREAVFRDCHNKQKRFFPKNNNYARYFALRRIKGQFYCEKHNDILK